MTSCFLDACRRRIIVFLHNGFRVHLIPALTSLSLQIRRLPSQSYADHRSKRAKHGMAEIFPVQLENNKFCEYKGDARCISECLKALGRVVIYMLSLKRKALYRCRLAAIGLSLKLTLSSSRTRRSGSSFLPFRVYHASCISLSTMHYDWLYFRLDDAWAPTLVSARSLFVTIICLPSSAISHVVSCYSLLYCIFQTGYRITI